MVDPTVTPLTALFSLLPLQSEHGSSVMYEDILDLVLSEDVSVYVLLSLANTPSQGLLILYEDPFCEVNWKFIAVLPEPFIRMSLSSSSSSWNGISMGIP